MLLEASSSLKCTQIKWLLYPPAFFNNSPQLCRAPICIKVSSIVPIHKKDKVTGLKDYWLYVLTLDIMKPVGWLILAHLRFITGLLLPSWGLRMCLHHILHHLDSPTTYARILFVEFSSAFNTVFSELLNSKLIQPPTPVNGSPMCEGGPPPLRLHDSQHRSTTGLCSLTTPVLSLHQGLHYNIELYQNNQIHGWHNCSGSHFQWWDHLEKWSRLSYSILCP